MPVNYCDNCYQPPGCCLCYASDEFVAAVAVDPDDASIFSVDPDDDDDFDGDIDPSKEPTDTVPTQADPPGDPVG